MDRVAVEPTRRRRTVASRLLVVLCIGAAVWAGALAVGSPMWVAGVAAALVIAAALTRVRGRDVVSFVAAWLRFRSTGCAVPGVVRDFVPSAGRPVGLRWEGRFVTAVVEVAPQAGRATRVGRDTAITEAVLPVEALAQCLHRHDVVLDGIDIVLHGCRLHDATAAGRVYEQLLGPLPAAAERSVWVVVRLDTTSCPGAIARRGGGSEGAARTVIAAARRVVRALDDAGCAARLLSAREIGRTVRILSHGAAPEEIGQTRTEVALPVGVNTGGSFDPRRLDAATTTVVWGVPSLASTLAVRLRPGDHESVLVGALARFTTRAPEDRDVPGLHPARSRHRESFLAALPLGIGGLEDVTSFRSMRSEQLNALALPGAGCGQLVGSDDSGRAVTVRMTGPGVRSVHLAAELYVVQQVVFRAVAVGARVVVHTDRAGAWRPLLGSAAGPDRLRLAGEFAGDHDFDTVVFDGVRPVTTPPYATTIHVHLHPDQWPREAPTVSLLQPGAAGERVVLTAGNRRMLLTLVTIAAETAHLGRARAPESAPLR